MSQSYPTNVAYYAGLLYWTNYGTVAKSYVDGEVWRCDPTSAQTCGATMYRLAGGEATAYGIAADASGVYWTTGRVVRFCPLGATCKVQPLAPPTGGAALGTPYALAIDATSVYWTDIAPGYGSVMRLAKP